MRVGCGGEVAGEVLAERLIRLRNSIDLLEVEFSHMAGEFAHTKQYDEEGYDSPISWIKANCHMAGGAAADRVCVGEQLGHLDRLGESCVALAAGEIGFAHLALIAHTSAALASAWMSAGCFDRRPTSALRNSAPSACTPATRPTPTA